MPYTDTTVTNLVVNVLTESDYNNIQSPSESELFFITDDSLTHFTTCTLPIFNAAGSVDVQVPGVSANCNPILDAYVDSAANKDDILEAWSHIYRADTFESNGNGYIKFYSDGATSRALTVMVNWL